MELIVLKKSLLEDPSDKKSQRIYSYLLRVKNKELPFPKNATEFFNSYSSDEMMVS